jgi:LmbE family N-acetylglucosaminyl deacetylase
MRVVCTVIAALVLVSGAIARGQGKARTLVAVWAHSDDEGPVAPILARYAREGVQVHMIIATDGAQGAANTSVPRGPEIAKLRAEEARCSAQALGIHPPILLGFPDGALGHYNADPSMLIRLAQRLQAELQRLRPDVLITWGPDGGYGHPDHSIVSSIVTQLVRAGAPGVPQRLFYTLLPPEGIRATVSDTRGATVRDSSIRVVHRASVIHRRRFERRSPVVRVPQDAGFTGGHRPGHAGDERCVERGDSAVPDGTGGSRE